MRTRPLLLSAIAAGACMSACQVYDFERVEPIAIAQTTYEEAVVGRRPKPNVMLLVDTSGSMTEPVDPSDPDCLLPDGYVCAENDPCDPAVCPTRWTELQAAVPKFLADTGPYVRFGLTTYPDTRDEEGLSALCRGASSYSVLKDLPVEEDDASLLAHAGTINDKLQGIPNAGKGRPKGGTPTSLSLRFVKDLPGLQDVGTERRQFVVLLTDGLPNCNGENPYGGGDSLCRCTLGNCSGPNGKLGCLDMDASVAAVKELAMKRITTIVIGFGAETAGGNGPAVLDAMARAGGFARTCKAGQTSCGPDDPCDPVTRLCQRTFYQASNQAELGQVLEDISKEVVNTEACLIGLEPSELPSDPKLIVVYVRGERTPSGEDTWRLTEDGVLFTGALCERILASTPAAPIPVKVSAIRQR